MIGRETGWERERYRGEREGIQGRKRGRDKGERERERERESERAREGGERKKFMKFYLVVLQSGYHKILTIQSLYRYTAVIELTKFLNSGILNSFWKHLNYRREIIGT